MARLDGRVPLPGVAVLVGPPGRADMCRKPSPPALSSRRPRDGYQLWELPGPGIGHVPTYGVEQDGRLVGEFPTPTARSDRHRDGPRSALPRLRARLRRGRRRRGKARVVRLPRGPHGWSEPRPRGRSRAWATARATTDHRGSRRRERRDFGQIRAGQDEPIGDVGPEPAGGLR